MSTSWSFIPQNPAQPIREPTQGEFFATEAIRSPAEALVREGVQNSLDASLRNSDPVRVRIVLGSGEHGLEASRVEAFFEGGWEHYQASGNGLKKAPVLGEECSYLLYEDFNTTGLIGDVEQWAHDPNVKNAFFYFFRAEGRTGKGEEDRGRWGIGKYVFPRSSRINSTFGLTIRCDDRRRLLMGRAVLKSHKVGEKHFTPDGAFGPKNSVGMALPIEDSDFIDEFSRVFRLKRTDESGLSIVVPFIDDEFSLGMLVEATVRGYFFPVLTGLLEVEVGLPNGEATLINRETLFNVVDDLPSDVGDDLKLILKLTQWAGQIADDEIFTLRPAPPTPEWGADFLTDEMAEAIRNKLTSGSGVAIRVPLTVRSRNRGPESSFFDVFFIEDVGGGGKPVFIREGIIVSDNKRVSTLRGFRSIVVINDKPLATLLGDSENPAHTQWQRDSSNFKDKYFNGSKYLSFVIRSAERLLAKINELDVKEDTNLLRDVFSITPPKDESVITKKKETQPKGGNEEDIEKPEVERRSRRFQVEQIPGGFSLFNVEGAEPPNCMEIRVAYDVRRGSALNRYKPADFRVERAPIEVVPVENIQVVEAKENCLLVEPTSSEFRLEVSGFDSERDIFVQVKAKEATDDTAD